jgi:hypothetical protein
MITAHFGGLSFMIVGYFYIKNPSLFLLFASPSGSSFGSIGNWHLSVEVI